MARARRKIDTFTIPEGAQAAGVSTLAQAWRRAEPGVNREIICSAMALVALRRADRGDLANEVLAHRIMDLAKAGERDPERLCEGVLKEFRAPPPQV
jgi:hypothetical protein